MEGERSVGILNIVTYIPLVGAILLLFFPKNNPAAIRWTATRSASADSAASIVVWTGFDPKASGTNIFQFTFTRDWIPSLGVKYAFGVDGIAILLILMTTLMGLIAIVSSFTAIGHREKEYYVLLLLL